MFKKLVLIISLLLIPFLAQAQRDRSSIENPPDNVYRPSTAQYWIGSADSHQFRVSDAQSALFPFFIWVDEGLIEEEVWYEFDVPKDQIPNQLAGIFITRIYVTADVYLNGELIGSGGSMIAPLAKNSHRPLYFPIPQSAWLEDDNKIRIRHKAYPGHGHIVDVLVGPDASLRPIYEQRNFEQQTIPKVLFIIEILSALMLFYVWLFSREDTSYLWFSLSMLMVSIFTLNQFLIDTKVSHTLWLAINNAALDWWTVSLIIFVHKRLGILKTTTYYALLAYALFVLIYYLSLPLNKLPDAAFFHLVSMTLSLINIFYIALKADRREGLPYIAFFASILIFAVHDFLMLSGIWMIRWLDGRFILFYAAPLVCFMVFGKIARELAMGMKATKDHAENLEMHINLTKQELEVQYEKLKSIAETKAVEGERERIYRDLHDDVGAKLLSLFYRANDLRLENLAQSALEDLRDIVSRKTLNGELLENTVTQMEAEARNRISEKGIKLNWTNKQIDNQYKLDERQFTHIKRMVREAISNALRHTQSSTEIEVNISVQAHNLSIEISNDGVEAEISQWQYGHGINNMTIRARELNGSLNISSNVAGSVSLTWLIPIAVS